jgi:hypothetical protein
MSQGALFAFGSVVFIVGGLGMTLAGLSLFRSWDETPGGSQDAVQR